MKIFGSIFLKTESALIHT